MASDILTQLQTCYDQLLTQFFSTISYLSQRHPLIAPDPVPGDLYTNPPQASSLDHDPSQPASLRHYVSIQPGPEDTDRAPYPLRPVSPRTFAAAQQELAEDLVRKGQQIEYLIANLPGMGRGEDEQAEQIKELVEKVQQMDKVRKSKRREMRDSVRKLDEVVLGMATSINHHNLGSRTLITDRSVGE